MDPHSAFRAPFFFSSRRRHTRCSRDWSSDVCSSDLWESMFTRSVFETSDMIAQHEALNAVSEMVDAGLVRSTLSEVIGPINAANLRSAHTRIESGRSVGKLVLEGFDA